MEPIERRKILEVEAAGIAAVRRTEADLRQVTEALDDMMIGLSPRTGIHTILAKPPQAVPAGSRSQE